VKILLKGTVICVLLLLPMICFGASALDVVKVNVNSVLEAMRNPALKGETGLREKQAKIREAAGNLFDFVELSKRTLGTSWNNFSPEQRKEFVRLYRSVLEDAYIDKITAYTNETVTFTKEINLSDTASEVDSVVAAKGGDIPINYRAIKRENTWKVYDVVIEGVSLVTNYRTQFREILGNNPPDVLLQKLRQKGGR
jgi:phospholipid transport system substrate-binding protein